MEVSYTVRGTGNADSGKQGEGQLCKERGVNT